MKNVKIKVSTVARIGALIVALINQCLAIFGKNALPFTENMTYQVVSLIATAVVVLINAWYNNDITRAAILAGNVLRALKDGKMTEAEIVDILQKTEESGAENTDMANNFFVQTANKFIENVKNRQDEEK